MTYRTCQNILIFGALLLLFSCLFFPSLWPKWGGSVDRFPQLATPTAEASTIISVWAYKKTGLYFCSDSRLYGKVKPGVYMTQEKAQESGYQPAGQLPCR